MISAIVVAAGKSVRMGRAKLTLPWGQTTVIGKVVTTLLDAGAIDIYIVTGGNQKELDQVLIGFPIKLIYNPNFADGEMVSSVQAGLKRLGRNYDATLIVLGDQPQIESEVVQAVMDSYLSNRSKIVIPSYQMHRGHPWLLDKSLWGEILELKPTDTLRDFLHQHQDVIKYVDVNTPSVIQDLDTPDDYLKFQP